MSCCYSLVIHHILTLMVVSVRLVLSDPNRCISLIPDNENCPGPVQTKYYYKYSTDQCLPFTDTGCLYLVVNRFDTLDECQKVCIKSDLETSTTTPPTPPSTDPPTSLPANICEQPRDRGTFLFPNFLERYWHNHTSRKCEMFTYSGMGGNQNNFMSVQDCIDACGSTIPPVNTALPIVSTSTSTISRTTTMPIPDPSVSYEILIEELNYYSSKDIDIPLMTSYQLTYATPSTKSSSTSHSETSSSTTAFHTNSRSTDTAEPVTTSSVIVKSHSDNSVQLTITVYTILFIVTLLILVCILVGSLIIVMYIKHRRTLLDIHSVKAVNPVSVKFWHSSGSKVSNTKYPQTKSPSVPGLDPALYSSTSVPTATGTSSTAATYQFTTSTTVSTNNISINNPNTTSTNVSTTSTNVSTSTSTSTTSTDGNSAEGNSTEDIDNMS